MNMAGVSKKNKNRSTQKRRGQKKNLPTFGSISNGGIKRVARRAGVKRISANSFPVIREAFDRFVDKLVGHSLDYTECAQRKTVTAQDVVYSLKRQGRNLYGYVFDKKAKKVAVEEES